MVSDNFLPSNRKSCCLQGSPGRVVKHDSGASVYMLEKLYITQDPKCDDFLVSLSIYSTISASARFNPFLRHSSLFGLVPCYFFRSYIASLLLPSLSNYRFLLVQNNPFPSSNMLGSRFIVATLLASVASVAQAGMLPSFRLMHLFLRRTDTDSTHSCHHAPPALGLIGKHPVQPCPRAHRGRPR